MEDFASMALLGLSILAAIITFFKEIDSRYTNVGSTLLKSLGAFVAVFLTGSLIMVVIGLAIFVAIAALVIWIVSLMAE